MSCGGSCCRSWLSSCERRAEVELKSTPEGLDKLVERFSGRGGAPRGQQSGAPRASGGSWGLAAGMAKVGGGEARCHTVGLSPHLHPSTPQEGAVPVTLALLGCVAAGRQQSRRARPSARCWAGLLLPERYIAEDVGAPGQEGQDPLP